MQTDTVFACYVEVDDFIVEEDATWQVLEISDSLDALAIRVKDEDGDVYTFHRPPFEHMTVVTSFEETFEFEDVDIDA